ncbi:hypothetical protein V8C34DRAFT_273630, partial [Trichoderma compactum]
MPSASALTPVYTPCLQLLLILGVQALSCRSSLLCSSSAKQPHVMQSARKGADCFLFLGLKKETFVTGRGKAPSLISWI